MLGSVDVDFLDCWAFDVKTKNTINTKNEYTTANSDLIPTRENKNIKIAYPTDANEVFVKMPKDIIDQLNSEGYTINDDEWDGNAVRLVTAWNTDPTDVDTFLNYIKS